uniref:Uridine 5'-monophosphate synthase n=1 Tax=Tabanus bromius TaxID=304241 RepID=A0A0K8TMZ9_TABBR
MAPNDHDLASLVMELFDINAFKFGDFKMKVGVNSPVYFDLRVIVSYPPLMDKITNLLVDFMNEKMIKCDHICGVPYTALPVATLMSIKQNLPMLVRRKEVKNYGTKKIIEGLYKAGDKCVIIEDVVTSGSSVLETVRDLRNEGIEVTDVIVVVDREQGGAKNIHEESVRMHSLLTLSYLLDTLKKGKRVTENTVIAVAKYIEGCQIRSDGSFVKGNPNIVNELHRTKMTYESRADLAKCIIAKKLFNLMATKKTNLCLAVDLTNSNDVLEVTDACGPYICLLKTHVDMITDFNEFFVKSLIDLSRKHNFLIMEDRKFADIGNTVAFQYTSGTFKISSWADLVTMHSIPGQGIIQGLKSKLTGNADRGVFVVAEMSSHGNLIDEKYKNATIKLATEGADADFIAGIVCQNPLFRNPEFIQLTPGVKIYDTGDNFGQQYQTPEYVIKKNGADIAVVGRGILEARCVEKAACRYRDVLWQSYCERIGVDDGDQL